MANHSTNTSLDKIQHRLSEKRGNNINKLSLKTKARVNLKRSKLPTNWSLYVEKQTHSDSKAVGKKYPKCITQKQFRQNVDSSNGKVTMAPHPNHTVSEVNVTSGRCIAIDCEMVGIGDGGKDNMLARVSLVEESGSVVYDTFVKAQQQVVDYRTAVSGVRPHDMENGQEFRQVQETVYSIIKGKLLIGHALRNDLKVLFLSHPKKYIRDTSNGDKLRSHIKNNTELGIKAKTYMDVGKLVPDDFMVNFIVSEINKLKGNSWLLDGFPRTVNQAKKLQNVQSIDLAVNLCVPFDVIINRVKGRWIHLPSGRVYNNEFNAPKVPGKDDLTGENLIQREDDKPDVVRKRLEEYEKLTKPVINFYKELGVLEEFHGKTSDEIWPGVLNCLNAHNVPKI
ncbi:Adenylate kinase 3 [Carabus blaptoides fortunei]